MADSKISDLAAITSLASTDEMVVASSGASKKITGANLKASVSGYTLLASGAVSGGKIAFSSISSAYNLLVIYALLRDTGSGGPFKAGLQFNGDTSSHYAYVYSGTTGSSGTSTSGVVGFMPDSTAAAGKYGFVRVEIPFYSQSTVNITAASQTEEVVNAVESHIAGFTWSPTSLAAINAITILTNDGTALATGCQALLYGA